MGNPRAIVAGLSKNDRIVRLQAVLNRVPVSRATIHRWERLGLFPKRIKLGPGCGGACGWIESQIDSWIAKRSTANY